MSDDVLIITTAYEQGVGHANRPELSNPYTGGDGRARLAWDLGREFGKKRTPAPCVGADGLPNDLWALVRAYGDCRADVAVNSRDASAAQYLKLAKSNLRDALAALASRPVGDVGAADKVRALLWGEHPECCGRPVVGAEYMGQSEMVCCGNPEPAMLNDAQIVASLRAMFPDAARTAGTAGTAAGDV